MFNVSRVNEKMDCDNLLTDSCLFLSFQFHIHPVVNKTGAEVAFTNELLGARIAQYGECVGSFSALLNYVW